MVVSAFCLSIVYFLVDIDEAMIDDTIDKLFGIIQTLIVAFCSIILDQVGNLVGNRFGNSVGVLIFTGTIAVTAYMVIRKAQS